MIDRIIQFYQRYRMPAESSGPVWGVITRTHQAPLIAALDSGDAQAVQSALNRFNTLAYGIDEPNCSGVHDATGQSLITRLADRFGLVAHHNPEQPSPTGNFTVTDYAATVKAIERALGLELSVPNYLGFDCAKGVPSRFYHYCASAFTILGWRGGIPPLEILEIGGGLGNLAIISRRWGSRSYTEIDLPQMSCVLAYGLSQLFGDDAVWLCGEPQSQAANFYLYPSTAFREAGLYKYSLIFNSDSLPEMPDTVRDEYIDFISDSLMPNGIFYSMNHESDNGGQGSVLSAVKLNGKLKLRARHPFMMRPGYVEEIYSL